MAPLIQPALTDLEPDLEGGILEIQHEAEIVPVDDAEGGTAPLGGTHHQEGVILSYGADVAELQHPLDEVFHRIGHPVRAEKGGAIDAAMAGQIHRTHEGHLGHLLSQGRQHGGARLIQQGQCPAIGLVGVAEHGLQQGHGMGRSALRLQQQIAQVMAVDPPGAEQHGHREHQQGEEQTQPGMSRIEPQ